MWNWETVFLCLAVFLYFFILKFNIYVQCHYFIEFFQKPVEDVNACIEKHLNPALTLEEILYENSMNPLPELNLIY